MDSSSEWNLQLLSRLKRGDESALVAIYDQYWKSLFVSAFQVLKDRESSEDILQNVFTTLWIKREQLEIHTSLEGYLHMAVRYQVYTHIRNGKRIKEVMSKYDQSTGEVSPENDLIVKEMHEQLYKIVNNLPERCRLIYKMRKEQHLTQQEIAAKLGLSRKTVENQITIALRKIRQELGTLLSFLVSLSLLT